MPKERGRGRDRESCTYEKKKRMRNWEIGRGKVGTLKNRKKRQKKRDEVSIGRESESKDMCWNGTEVKSDNLLGTFGDF